MPTRPNPDVKKIAADYTQARDRVEQARADVTRAEAHLTHVTRALRDALDQSITNAHPPALAQRKPLGKRKPPRTPKPPPTAKSGGATARLIAAIRQRPNDWRFIARKTYRRNGQERKAQILAAYAAKRGYLKRSGPGRFEAP